MDAGLLKDKRGSALMYVIIVVFFTVIIGGMLLGFLTQEIRINKITEEKIKAKYLAEAGVEHALLETHSRALSTVTDSAGNTLYAYGVTISDGEVRIESYGYLNNSRRIRIDCKIQNDEIEEWTETIVR
jgi:type II secretory pathway component PulK